MAALLVAGRGTTAVAAAGVALLLAASPAVAFVSATTDGADTVSITSNNAGDVMAMTCFVGQATVNGNLALPVMGCQDVSFVEVDANGGADSVNLAGLTRPVFPALSQTSVDVEDASADSVTGSEVRDVVHADNADTVSTGVGDDWVQGAGTASGGEGNDTLRLISGAVLGGGGDDLIVNPGAGPIDGGGGFDTVVIDYSSFTTEVPLGLALTDASINGTIDAAGIEAYHVTSSDGVEADIVDSRFYSGRVSFQGRAGDDTFLGGPGADVADLGLGNDVVDAGPGSDLVLGGDGDDTINARDGFGDVVECGPGTDTVTADRADALSGCEHVSLPAPETSRIDGPKKLTKGVKAYFTFAASVASATFECQVDAGAYKPCASPFKVRSKKLKKGKHTLTVRAVQPAGNADPTPSTFTFKVKPKQHAQA
jgi:Ca2+-binding RTX toxin-like protein